MRGFMFPGTAAIMLRQHTWLGDIAVASALHNYGRRGERFFIKSVKPGNHHYLVEPVSGGFRVVPCRMAPGAPGGFTLA